MIKVKYTDGETEVFDNYSYFVIRGNAILLSKYRMDDI